MVQAPFLLLIPSQIFEEVHNNKKMLILPIENVLIGYTTILPQTTQHIQVWDVMEQMQCTWRSQFVQGNFSLTSKATEMIYMHHENHHMHRDWVVLFFVSFIDKDGKVPHVGFWIMPL